MNSYSKDYTPQLSTDGLYSPAFEHEACGVGLVANVKGRKSHSVIDQGLEVLINLGHRGASGADAHTGDGAGIMVQMPHQFIVSVFGEAGIAVPELGDYGVGMTFLPRDPDECARCESAVERIVAEEGQEFLGWRDVPVSPDKIGTLSERIMPTIRQFLVGRGEVTEAGRDFDLRLLIIRKQAEKAILGDDLSALSDFYICSLSSKTVVYKGLIMAHQLRDFYHDLSNEEMITAFALVHSRFSTNTLGAWRLAHPYRFIIHNGEINTLQGNINWMTAREKNFESDILGDDVGRITPVVTPLQSDTATLDNALDTLLASGRSLDHALMMLIPEAWSDQIPMDQSKQDFYEYHSSMMEPWDGPALVIASDGEKICAVLDRNGLRPCRYLVTTDDILVMASETGVLDVPVEKVLYKERIYPGRMFMLDTIRGEIVQDSELKAALSSRRPYGQWLEDNMVQLEDLPEPTKVHGTDFETLESRQDRKSVV